MLKTGFKQLFYRNERGRITEMNPLCLLDFYVVEEHQRGGHGKVLYEKMLEVEQKQPSHLAIDRPSQKLLNFMARHYGLQHYVPQNNNYVIYNQFFDQRSIRP
jgi:alpha-tubulin N-acetyltransferase 1